MVQHSRPSPQSSGPSGLNVGKHARPGPDNGSKAAAITPPSKQRGLYPYTARDRRSYAAIDLGTNNCRLLIAKPSADGFIVVDAFSRIVRLGEGLAATGRLSDEALTDLGWRSDQAKQIIAALKVERARLPDKPGAAPKIVKDSPFAALAALTEAPPARPKRRRPRRKAKA